MTVHSPTPWYVDTKHNAIYDTDDNCLADCWSTESGGHANAPPPAQASANARLIVRAVNSHGDLLEACVEMLHAMAVPSPKCSEVTRAALKQWLPMLTAAVAKATGQESPA